MSDSPKTHVLVDMSASMTFFHDELVDSLKVLEEHVNQSGDDVRIAGYLYETLEGLDSPVFCEGTEAMYQKYGTGPDSLVRALEDSDFNEGDTVLVITDGYFYDDVYNVDSVVSSYREENVIIQGIAITYSDLSFDNSQVIKRQMEQAFGRSGPDGFRVVDSPTKAVQVASSVIITKSLESPDLNDPRLPEFPEPLKSEPPKSALPSRGGPSGPSL